MSDERQTVMIGKEKFAIGQQQMGNVAYGIEKMPRPWQDQPEEKNHVKNGKLPLYLSFIFPIST